MTVLCTGPGLAQEKLVEALQAPTSRIARFVDRWKKAGGTELGNAQLFYVELFEAFDLRRPEPYQPEKSKNLHVFEYPVSMVQADGKARAGRTDAYLAGRVLLEAKIGMTPEHYIDDDGKPIRGVRRGAAGFRGSPFWDQKMREAKAQAEGYIHSLPPEHGRPPFLIVTDVGHALMVYSDFKQVGTYTPYPSANDYVIYLDDLQKPAIQARLQAIFTDPYSLDPTLVNEKVTLHIVDLLCKVAEDVEGQGHSPEVVTRYLIGVVLSFYAEDVGLLPAGSIETLIAENLESPSRFTDKLISLWKTMETGGFSQELRSRVIQFGGGFFANAKPLPLSSDALELLHEAAQSQWSNVDSSILGTLLERALKPEERHRMGAHYTPTAYVEKLVLHTVMKPLRQEWDATVDRAIQHLASGDVEKAVSEVEAFHQHLCSVKVLDPSVGGGNFLAVSYNLLRDFENEVFNALLDLGLSSYEVFERDAGVSPRQFYGIDVSENAAAISELVVTIAHLQKHRQLRGSIRPAEPVFEDCPTIECRDALLAWDAAVPVMDDEGNPVMRWDGKTVTLNSKTGDYVPDESARVLSEKYINCRPAAPWPTCDYIVGNPPFLGANRIRPVLGDGYADALAQAYPFLQSTIDLCMVFWARCAMLVRDGEVQGAGLITTNTISQPQNRRVVEAFVNGEPPVRITMAAPNHPWSGAAVRIAMTSIQKGSGPGVLITTTDEVEIDGRYSVTTEQAEGIIHPHLALGPNLSQARPLLANAGLSNRGMELAGRGFIVKSAEEARSLGLGQRPGLEQHIRPYKTGRDVAFTDRKQMVIDLYGLSIEDVEERYPEVFQWMRERVLPVREQSPQKDKREKWWLFGGNRATLRAALAGLPRYIATPRTARRRYFVFLEKDVVPDAGLVVIASDDAYVLAVLSSRIHYQWLMAFAGSQGQGDDPIYIKSHCFDMFPFPPATEEQKATIRALGEKLEHYRDERLRNDSEVTLSKVYAVFAKLRHDEELNEQERGLCEKAGVQNLMTLHAELDQAVAEAYGWGADMTDEEVVTRLLHLNMERKAEEKSGKVRWLRPDLHAPGTSNFQLN
ncbi:MAG: class I SAM-dependent DNA methyltransferase [Planctomycetaceae bacterium]|nr:class I SAM-dependent DNA methyltransferase [Planctomycetaceae bacterium]